MIVVISTRKLTNHGKRSEKQRTPVPSAAKYLTGSKRGKTCNRSQSGGKLLTVAKARENI